MNLISIPNLKQHYATFRPYNSSFKMSLMVNWSSVLICFLAHLLLLYVTLVTGCNLLWEPTEWNDRDIFELRLTCDDCVGDALSLSVARRHFRGTGIEVRHLAGGQRGAATLDAASFRCIVDSVRGGKQWHVPEQRSILCVASVFHILWRTGDWDGNSKNAVNKCIVSEFVCE